MMLNREKINYAQKMELSSQNYGSEQLPRCRPQRQDNWSLTPYHIHNVFKHILVGFQIHVGDVLNSAD